MTDEQHIAEVVRQEWPRVVASLLADFGDLSEAEDAAQDAAEEALAKWPEQGLPDRPGAWLTVVGRRRAIDRLRRASRGREKTDQLARLQSRNIDPNQINLEEVENRSFDAESSLLRDEQLRLIFGCCHPSLGQEVQMALTLRSLGGMTTAEIARAFLVHESTMAQRLVRAKKKISMAAVPFKIPPDHELLARTNQVRTIVYLIFNEGYDSSDGTAVTKQELCSEAVRLAQLVADLTPDDPESLGLFALLLLIQARSAARIDADGDLVLLADQDRSRWDQSLIGEGEAVLDRALRLNKSGPYQIQAAINALHDTAATSAETDWEQIELLYRQLVLVSPTPVVRLNHAVAVAMARTPVEGLAILDRAELAESLENYQHYHSARGELLSSIDAGRAKDALEQALALTANPAERRLLKKKIGAL